MANTFIKIATVTVGAGGAASMAFSSIVGTYTDLLVKISSRADADVVDVICSVNASALDVGKRLRGNGVNAASTSTAQNFGVNNSAATANTFSSAEWYFPNYAGSDNKSVSMDGGAENNGTDAYLSLVAGLESTASAITALSFAPSSGNFVQYSTATLYGIKKN